MTAIDFPPGVDAARVLAPLNSSAWEHSPAYRRAVTENDPVAFAITYLSHHLVSPLTGGVMSFAPMHIAMAKLGISWIEPTPHRDAVIAPRSAGKALALDTPVLTVDRGWTTHGDLRVGDRVFDETGAPCRVSWTSPRWDDRPCYRVTFSTGDSVVADAEHEWPVSDRYRTTVGAQTTAEIARKFLLGTGRGFREHRYSVPTCGALEYPNAALPVDPYVLGAWLGDGDSGGGRISVGHADVDHLVEQLRKRGENPHVTYPPSSTQPAVQLSKPRPDRCPREHVLEVRADGSRRPCRICIGDHQRVHYGTGTLAPCTNQPLIARLRGLGVLGGKYIPEQYLTASADQRRELMRGLMDTDGSVTERSGSCEYSGTNERLCRGVFRLALSLGLKATWRTKRATLNGRDVGPAYRITFRTADDVFTLPRKLDRLRVSTRPHRQIVNVERMPDQTTSCISVDSPSHLYLVGEHLIPTHNSTWAFLVLPLWAMSHGHRNYVVAFADAASQAEGHLATLRQEIERNERLMGDFPELVPARGGGARNNARDLLLSGGAAFSARGMDSRALGAKSGADRPDLLIGDDLEPMSKYSAEVRDARLRVLLDGVLPMGDRASVLLVGTVVRYGSIMHTLAQHARGQDTGEGWPVAEGFAGHYFPPILGSGTRWERSCWPARWPLDELRRIRETGGSKWWLNFLNDPPRPGEAGAGWTEDMFTYGGADVDRWTVVVDVAPTSKATSDQTAVAVVGVDVSGRHLVVAECRGVRAQPGEIRDLVHRLARTYRVREVHAEVNQGHDTWKRILQPMPQGTRLVPFHTSSNKRERILDLVDLYGRGGVIHTDRLGQLERQALAWPDVVHDDLVDVVALGAERLAAELVRR